ncbi:MAG: glycoside hydrolase family 2 TIM barrel-domain containing protein [Paludibacteraceae bacterium]
MKNNILFIILLIVSLHLTAQTRREYLLEKNWKFSKIDDVNQKNSDFDDTQWESVTVPHDWAITGPFGFYDVQNVKIEQDGMKEAMEQAGRTGGLPFIGVGWYRNIGNLPKYEENKRVTLVFDGAMSYPQIYVNGQKAGEWGYGYNSFYLDITDFLNKDNAPNVLAVRLENKTEQSRWYPGAGLYRNVHVVITNNTHIPVWGTYITTPEVTGKFAKINIRTQIEGDKEGTYTLSTAILNNDSKQVAKQENSLSAYGKNEFVQDIIISNPTLWDIENPVLYKAVSKLYNNGKLIDEYETTFGIRTIKIIPDQGFFLNGKRVMFKGVCNHHDLGPLGAAVNDAAIRRQIRILKDMGVNAIRTSHNMPAPELVKACDEMGMMLMPESFDEWKIAKVKNGYNTLWNKYAENDIVNLIHHYRNNPSVVMWSIGNEVPDQGNNEYGPKRNRFLQDICHREDPTRPVTNGMDQSRKTVYNNFAALLDVPGFNYKPHFYNEYYKALPQQIILGSETASTVSSRGVYKFPVERLSMKQYDDMQSSSYDLEHCSWSDLPEDNFIWEGMPSYIGEFVWTGFDYLGEPTPYYSNWPSHSSYFGIVDLAGIPKDRYYLYRSHWNTQENTLHILPHWNWKGREGKVTPIFVYTNHPSAELFINGKSQGIQKKDLSVNPDSTNNKDAQRTLARQKKYRLMWMDTKYEPGTIKVVAYDNKGNVVAEQEVKTAGTPYKIVLKTDRNKIKADGKDIAFINVKIVDKEGNFCPVQTDEITIKVSGAGKYNSMANGNAADLTPFQSTKMKLFSGQLTALVKSLEKKGKIQVEAYAKGVKSDKIIIDSE